MARAFTKESDNESVDDPLPEPVEVLAPGAPNYITPDGASRMRARLGDLNTHRTKLVQALTGDADPAEKKKLRDLDRRIRYLDDRIARLEIVAPRQGTLERVVFGAWVAVCGEDGAERAIQICGVDEADPDKGRVSWISPLAKALIGREVGDDVMLELPTGSTTLEIVGIAPTSPNESGDTDR
jgi:transcription elongation factor GreB